MSIPTLITGEAAATEDEIKAYEKVQYLLTCSQTMPSDDLAGAIVALLPLDKHEIINFLVRELIIAYMDIKSNKDVILETILAFCDNYPFFRQQMAQILGTPLSDTRVKIFHFRILRYLFKKEVYTIDDINTIIAHYSPHFENQYVALICFFGPELETENGDNFRMAFEIIDQFQNLSPSWQKILKTYLTDPMRASKFTTGSKWKSTIKVTETGFADYDIAQEVLTQNEKSLNRRMKTDSDLITTPPLFYPDPYFMNRPPAALLSAYTGYQKFLSSNLYKASSQKDSNGNGLKEYALAGGDVRILELTKTMNIFRLKGEPTIDPQETQKKYNHIEYYPPLIKRNLGAVGLHAAVPSTLKKEEEARTNFGVLEIAALYRRLDALKCVVENLELIKEDYISAFQAAASVNFLAGMDYLLSLGIDVNDRDQNKKTALHQAAENGAMEAIKFLLIQPGININATDDKHQTPLHCAAYAKDKSCYNLLSQLNGIDTTSLDIYRNTPAQVFEESERIPL